VTTTAYQVGVSLLLSSNATQIFSALGQHFLGLQRHMTNFQNNWKKTAMLIGGGVGIFGGVAVLKGAEKLIDHGNHLVKIQRDMAQAGATSVQVQNAYAKAWELTAKYQNMGAADILKVMNDARAIFGNQDVATKDIEPLIRIGSFLRAYQGTEKGKATHDSIVREITAGLKSGEISGNITAEDMSKHADNLAAMKVYYGDQVSIARYLQAQRAAGVSYLTSGDEFRYGMFPALVQEFGPGAGVMQQTLWAKTVAGVMNRTRSLQAMDQYGILKPGEVQYDKVGRAIGLKHGGESIVGSKVAAENYPKWVMETLIPKVLQKTGIKAGADGRFSKTDLTTIASIIGQFFPDRNAMKAVMEAVVQYPKLLKDAAGLLKVRKDWETYTAGSWDYQKEAFGTQWTNFLDALGAPIVKSATERLAQFNGQMAGFSQWAAKSENAESIKNILTAIIGFAAFFTAGSIAAILLAIGPAGWLIGGLAALAVVLARFGFLKDFAATAANTYGMAKPGAAPRYKREGIDPDAPFDMASNAERNKREGQTRLQRYINTSLRDVWTDLDLSGAFAGLGAKIYDAIKNEIGSLGGLFTNPTPKGSDDKMPGLGAPMRFDPGTSQPKMMQTAFSFNVDGRVLAQTVIEQMESLAEHATGSPNYNGQSHFARADSGFATV
jgi:hypothetical protein